MARFGLRAEAAAVVWALFGVVASPAAAPERPSAAEVVAALQARYDSTASFRAAFRQEIESLALGQKLDSRGTVYYRRPGRMRWEFVAPEKQTVVADGRSIWMYQEAQRQVVKMELASAFRTTTPLSFLVGLGKLRDDFDAELAPGPVADVVRLRLRPREKDGDVGALELELAPGTYDIVGAVVTDATGGMTRWRFSDLERNVALDDTLFSFVVPEGVDVVVPPS
jgi:outer membrane lipoprotein carrier protein